MCVFASVGIEDVEYWAIMARKHRFCMCCSRPFFLLSFLFHPVLCAL